MIGNQLALLSVPWFVLSTTGSAAKTGLTAAFSVLPIVLAGFFGGAVVDNLGHRRASIIADLVSGLPIAAIPLLFTLHALPFWALLALVFVSAFFDGPGTTAREALIPELARMSNISLERASSLLQIVERGSRLAGAPLAGLLIAFIGAQNVLWVDAATFAFSGIVIALFVPRPPASQTTTNDRGYFHSLADGLRYIARDPLMRLLVLTIVVTNLLDTGKVAVIYPVFAKQIFHSSTVLGLIVGISGGGAVAGAAIYASMSARYSRRLIVAGGFLCISLTPLIYSLLPPLWVVFAVQFLSGVASGPINPVLMTVQYERIPRAMLGRVLASVTASVYAGMPLGGLLAGFAIENLGIRATLLAVGVVYLATTSIIAASPALKLLDHRNAGPTQDGGRNAGTMIRGSSDESD